MPAIVAEKRTKGTAEALRAEKRIPGVVYGANIDPASLSVPYNEFEKLYNDAGYSTLIDLSIGSDAPTKVLIQDLQFDPVTNFISHIDFRRINMNEEMETTVELTFTGVAPAEKEAGGTLMKTLEEVEVKCLPKDLVSEIVVDISGLKSFDQVIHVSDLQVPAGITILTAPDTTVVKVAAPLTEDEMKKLEEGETKDIAEIELSEKKGKKEEEGAEAAPAEAKKE